MGNTAGRQEADAQSVKKQIETLFESVKKNPIFRYSKKEVIQIRIVPGKRMEDILIIIIPYPERIHECLYSPLSGPVSFVQQQLIPKLQTAASRDSLRSSAAKRGKSRFFRSPQQHALIEV